MKILRAGAVACALALRLPAGTIDVSTAATGTLRSGDTLTLLFSGSSFFSHAAALGISPYPAQFTFSFSAQPVSFQGQFEITLESADGSASAAWPDALTWSAGKIQSSCYTGDVSTIYGGIKPPRRLGAADICVFASRIDARICRSGRFHRHSGIHVGTGFSGGSERWWP